MTARRCTASRRPAATRWSYQIGTNADYDATEKRIVAWSGNDLYILNNRGRLIYNNKMSDTVQFASAGDGVRGGVRRRGGQRRGFRHQQQRPDRRQHHGINQTLLDIGFFMASTANNTQPTELMWMLGAQHHRHSALHRAANLPTRQALHRQKLHRRVHRLFDLRRHGTLNVVTTRQILHQLPRAGGEQPDADLRLHGRGRQPSGNTVYRLLVPAQGAERRTSASRTCAWCRRHRPRDPPAQRLHRREAGHEVGLASRRTRSMRAASAIRPSAPMPCPST